MSAVQHIAFKCRDMRKSEQFYTRHFGFRHARVFSRGQPGEFVMLRLGGTCIELFQSGNPAAGRDSAEPEVGFQHLAFEVRDIGKSVADLKADGFETGPIIDCSSIVPGMRICFFNDPDGNRIELMQGYADEE